MISSARIQTTTSWAPNGYAEALLTTLQDRVNALNSDLISKIRTKC
ncbi:hypothetical protein ABZ737_07975 [Streptomyces sp. NPDC013087]